MPLEPYYKDDAVTIYHADCREVLPKLTGLVATTITDFPYAIGVDYGESFEDTRHYLAELVQSVLPLLRIITPLTALTPGVGNMWMYPEPTWTLAWVNSSASGSSAWGFATWQPVLVYGPDPYLKRGLGRRPDSLVVTTGGGSLVQQLDIGHPCPKPVLFMSWLMQRLTTESTVILDPFAGSGTTLRVAKDLGHRAIGIEIEEKFCEIAAKRCAQDVMELAS